jgi:FAD/FMN-containing dehydrogenase/Fe-S oxidoreductase
MANLDALRKQMGENLKCDDLHRTIYATDASVYREKPFGVAWPTHVEDLHVLLHFAKTEGVPLIPRTAGTSLAGQVVGSGLVIDFSRYMNRILEINPENRTAKVEPGVIRDDLNLALKKHQLFFGPNTSTANRCMIGGMVGNNSCGSTSIVYGSTRDQLLALDTLLSDGSEARFEALNQLQWETALRQPGMEGRLYRHISDLLTQHTIQVEIRHQYPKASIHRRNTGYALDMLLDTAPFTPGGPDFNFCRLLAGSEGTLALSHRITLQLAPLPPAHQVLVCAHYHSMRDMTEAVLTAMQHTLFACELMDRTVLDCTKASREQQQNRFFLEGDPAAVLIMECRGHSPAEAESLADVLIKDLKGLGSGYAFPKVKPPHVDRVWALRAAGLGVLANLPGDAKAVACIEDTAVALADLPDYIDDLDNIIKGYGQRAAYFAHAGAGEIHVRPILDLKKASDQQLFQNITTSVAGLVKKYKGSFSGEHGDGRLRGSFIPELFGPVITQCFETLKETWDPLHLLNPGKITGVPPMLHNLRYTPDQATRSFKTLMDFDDAGGILRMAERCNGSGDCRKLPSAGGTMCPSYQVTRQEKDSTRARANALREYLTHSERNNPFDEPALAEVMDLCLSCKGCTRECPSGVDMTALKSEWQFQAYQTKGVPLRARLFGQIDRWNRLASLAPQVTNWILAHQPFRSWIGRLAGIHSARQLPALNPISFRRWFQNEGQTIPVTSPQRGHVWLFADEFTTHYDLSVGKAAVRLLHGLGYRVGIPTHVESGRAAMSKGLLAHAQKVAQSNIDALHPLVNEHRPLLGLEPSAILSFRDEYLHLAGPDLKTKAEALSTHTFLLEEFLYNEAKAGRISPADFDTTTRHIVLHGHCHQKALSEQSQAAFILGLPAGHQVEILPTGCCGMAGSFGYEKEHYSVSQKIGELVLFPALRTFSHDTFIAASGHSCRHQIKDGVGRSAKHVAEILADALRN